MEPDKARQKQSYNSQVWLYGHQKAEGSRGSAKITESPQARPDESLSESQLRQIPPSPASPAPTLPENTEAEAQTPQASKSITKFPDSNLEITAEFPPMRRVTKRRSAAKKNLFGPPAKKLKKMDDEEDKEGDGDDEEEEETEWLEMRIKFRLMKTLNQNKSLRKTMKTLT